MQLLYSGSNILNKCEIRTEGTQNDAPPSALRVQFHTLTTRSPGETGVTNSEIVITVIDNPGTVHSVAGYVVLAA